MSEKKTPLRRCVGCGEMKSKKDLLRVVRREDGSFLLDTTGRVNGRGAYLCPRTACLERAMKNRGLERSFKEAIPPEIYENLRREMGELETG